MIFFFSSRRRHTRFSRDWSSDVCSSDLLSSGIGPSAKRKTSCHRHAARDRRPRDQVELHSFEGPSQNQRRRSEEHTSELQSRENLVCRLLLEKKKKNNSKQQTRIESQS